MLVAGFTLGRPGFDARLSHAEFVVQKVALGQIFSEYFASSSNTHSTNFSTFIIIIITITFIGEGAGLVRAIATDIPSGLSLTQPHE
jgi:hypothetical protein